MRHRRLTGLAMLAAMTAAGSGGCSAQQDSPGDEEASPTIVAVHVAPIVRTTLRGYVTAWGTVEPQQATRSQPPASARIAALVPGLVAEVRCAEGQRVEKDAILFQLDTRVADVAVEKERQAAEYARQVFERQKKLGPGEATSLRLYQEAEQNLVVAENELKNAEAQRELLTIRSPLAGTVVRVAARPGDTVDLTNVLAEVVDLDRLVVSAAVRSVDVPRVKLGQPAELWTEREATAAPAKGATTYPSAVVFIGSEVDPGTDTVRVRTEVRRGSGLRPGQFVNLRIASEERHDRLAVPVESVVTQGGVSEIAVVEGGRAVKRTVTVGLRDGNLVEVEGEGLKEGMTVVTEGAYGLPQESQIRVIGG